METTVKLDDELVTEAMNSTGLSDVSAVIHKALTFLVQREAARRLADMGGTQPGFEAIPRRRPEPAE